MFYCGICFTWNISKHATCTEQIRVSRETMAKYVQNPTILQYFLQQGGNHKVIFASGQFADQARHMHKKSAEASKNSRPSRRGGRYSRAFVRPCLALRASLRPPFIFADFHLHSLVLLLPVTLVNFVCIYLFSLAFVRPSLAYLLICAAVRDIIRIGERSLLCFACSHMFHVKHPCKSAI